MKKTGKVFRKFLLGLMTMILVVSSAMVVFAAGTTEPLKTLKASKKSVVLYVNDGVKNSATPSSDTITITATTKSGGAGAYVVSSKNYQMVNVTKEADNKITLTAGSWTGKTQVIVADANNLKKQVKINVTVKNKAGDIYFGQNVKTESFDKQDAAGNLVKDRDENKVEIATNGSLPLGASSYGTGTKLSYSSSDKNVVKVSGKGVLTAGKKAGKATIKVSANQKEGKNKFAYEETVEVTVTEKYAESVKILYPGITGKKYILNLKNNENSVDKYGYIIAEAYKANGERINEGVIYTSNKPAIASVDKSGKVTAYSVGKATITVAPAEGTKLKGKAKPATITVNVTSDADLTKINIPNDQLTVLKNKTVKIGATVDKKVNKNDKKLSYKVIEGSDKVTVSSKGVIKGTAVGEAKISVMAGNVSETVTVKVVDSVKIDKAVLDQKLAPASAREYNKGDKVDLGRMLMADTSLKGISFKYATSNNAAATVTGKGIVTCKGVGDAKITVTIKKGADTISTDVNIKVKDTDAAFVKAMDTKVNYALTANDFVTWTGMNVSYVAKNRQIVAQVTSDVDANGAEIDFEKRIISIFNMFDLAATDKKDEIKSIQFTTSEQGKPVTYTYTAGTLKKGDAVIGTYENYSTAVRALGENLAKDSNLTSDWIGSYLHITITNQSDKSATYSVFFTGTAANMDSIIDRRISNKIDNKNVREKVEQTGIASVSYNSSKNIFTIGLADGTNTKKIDAAAEALKPFAKDAFVNAFADAVKIDAEIQESGKAAQFYSNDCKGGDLEAALDSLYNGALNQLAEKKISTIDQLDEIVVLVKVTFKNNAGAEYAINYAVQFKQTVAAIDARIDREICTMKNELAKGAVFSTAEYNENTNTLKVGIKDLSSKIEDASNTGILNIFNAILSDTNVASAKVITGKNGVNEITDVKDLKNRAGVLATIKKAVLNDKLTTCGDLVGQAVYVEVTYKDPVGGHDEKVMYTVTFDVVTFDVDYDGVKNAVKASVLEAVNTVEKDVKAISTIEENQDGVLVVSLDSKEKGEFANYAKDLDKIYEIFDKIYSVDKNADLQPTKVELVSGAKKEAFTDGKEGKPDRAALVKALETVTGAKKIEDLAGKKVSFNVTYTAGDKDVVVEVNLEFKSVEVAADETSKEAVEEVVEEVTEETTEEVVEETAEAVEEETTEEVVEETAEVVEETTEEVVEETAEAVEEETTEEVVEEAEEATEEVVEEA